MKIVDFCVIGLLLFQPAENNAFTSGQRAQNKQMLRPALGGSVQVVSSTHGELGPDRTGAPLTVQPEVEVVEETK